MYDVTHHAKLCCISNDVRSFSGNSIRSYWNSNDLANIRDHMITGEGFLKECEACKNDEKVSGHSRRIDELDKLTYHSPLSFPTHLSLKLSNVCNLKCIMCGPSYSTKWNEDVKDFSLLRPNLTKEKTNILNKKLLSRTIDDFIHSNSNQEKTIDLYGGEPFYDKSFWKIISSYKTSLTKNITINLNTNGTKLSYEELKILSKFKSANVSFSIDGIDDVFEFVRFPAKWHKVKENLLNYKQLSNKMPNYKCGIYITISSFSLIGLRNLLNFCNKHRINRWINFATREPSNEAADDLCTSGIISFSHPAMLPDDLKNKILNSLTPANILHSDEFDKIKNFITQDIFTNSKENKRTQKKFKLYCELIKKKRNVDFKYLVKKYYDYDL